MSIFGIAKKFTDAFFDGLKKNATNRAIEAAKKNKAIKAEKKNKVVQTKIVDNYWELEKASRKLHKMLRDLE